MVCDKRMRAFWLFTLYYVLYDMTNAFLPVPWECTPRKKAERNRLLVLSADEQFRPGSKGKGECEGGKRKWLWSKMLMFSHYHSGLQTQVSIWSNTCASEWGRVRERERETESEWTCVSASMWLSGNPHQEITVLPRDEKQTGVTYQI